MGGSDLVETLVLSGFLGMVFFFPLVVVLLVIWLPFAVWIAASTARKHGLEVRPYAVAGGAYSMLFVLPWIYLVMRMAGDRPSRGLVKWAYVALFVAWLWFPVIGGMTYVASGAGALTHVSGLAQVMQWLSFIVWLATLIWLLYVNGRDSGSEDEWWNRNKEEVTVIMPKLEYVAPFIVAM